MRSFSLALLGTALWAGLLTAGEPAADPPLPDLGTRKSGTDWPKFLGPTGDSVSPEKGILNPWPKGGLRVVWQQKVGEGYSMPTIYKGRLFQFDRVENKARLRCLKSETGEQLWEFTYPTDYKDKYNYDGGPRTSPLVDGERVYIHGVEGMLHCLDIRTGKVVWQVDTFAKFNVIQNFFGVGCTPVLEGEKLILQVGGSPAGSDASDFLKLKGNGSGIVAFDRKTGKVLYSITDELASYASPTLATIHGRRWCFLFARGGLIGFEPNSGKVDFHFPWRAEDLESVNAANPVVIGDKVLISETYGPGAAMLQVKPGGYKVLWSDADKLPRKKSLQCHWNTPIHHEGYVYGCSGRHDSNAELRCVELATGKVMWSIPRLTRTSLLYVDGHFLGLSEYGHLFLFKATPKEFEPISIMEIHDKNGENLLQYPCWAAPILSHGLLYVRGNNQLVCLELIPERKE